MNALVANYKDSPMSLKTVTILGLNRTVTNVNVNGQSYSNFRYYNVNNVCTLLNCLDKLNVFFSILNRVYLFMILL